MKQLLSYLVPATLYWTLFGVMLANVDPHPMVSLSLAVLGCVLGWLVCRIANAWHVPLLADDWLDVLLWGFYATIGLWMCLVRFRPFTQMTYMQWMASSARIG